MNDFFEDGLSFLTDLLSYPWWILKVYVTYRCFRVFFAFCKAVFIYRIAPFFYHPPLETYKNRWTVVTGGTDGIGKAYTIELAKNQFKKFVLIGRNPTKLDNVKKHLKETYGAEIRTYVFDFANGDYDKLRAFLNFVDDIGFVVNSVGTGREKMEKFGENPEADNLIFKVNGFGAAQFLSMVLEPMRRNGGGQIISLSSCLGIRPAKNLAAYSSTKSMISFISYSIDREYDNINVQILAPAVVATSMTYYKESSQTTGLLEKLFVVTPAQLAKEAIKTIGLTSFTTGTFAHEMELLIRHLPAFIQELILNQVLKKENQRVLRILEAGKAHTNNNISSGAAA